MTFSQKYTLIQLLEDVPEDTQFVRTAWPLHSTVVDIFAIDWDAPTMIRRLEALLATHEPAASLAEDDTFFGPEKQTRVVLLHKTDSLCKLHHDVVSLLNEGGLRPNSPQYVGEGYVPHSTVQAHARLNKGDHVTFDALTLIDMFPDGDPYQRRVLKTIRIGAAAVNP